jgi:hypothetical protein
MRSVEFRRLFEDEANVFGVHPTLVIVHRRCIEANCAARDVAAAQQRPPKVWFVHRALYLPEENLVALIRHELGHICDPTPRREGSEQRADDIAEMVTGQKIRYDDRDLQTVGPGRYPRPRYLPQ